MPELDALKMAIDDARVRQAAVLQLIYFTDQQALGLLRLYVTLGLGAVAGTAAGLGPDAVIPRAAAMGLAGAALVLFVGCFLCFRAMQSAQLTFPGRGADFWRAALFASEHVELCGIVKQYLEDLTIGQTRDRETNKRTAAALKHAKWAGLAAPATALIMATIAFLYL